MNCLSKLQIEKISAEIMAQYKQQFLPEKRLCYSVDPVELAAMLGIRVDYHILSTDGTILGVTSAGEALVAVFDEKLEEQDYTLDGSTILVEKRLRNHVRNRGRLNFTIAHEVGHQIIYRLFPEVYTADCRAISTYRTAPHRRVEDWTEWQADSFAAALLMPQDAVLDAMFYVGIHDKMKVLSKKYSQYKYDRFCEMADLLGVSKTALSYRMEQLGLLERNMLGT